MTNIRKEKGAITADPIQIKSIVRKYMKNSHTLPMNNWNSKFKIQHYLH